MRCAIYTRVSTDEQARPEHSSLETQAEICRHYAEVHREQGWEIIGVYEDSGFSGRDLDRPAIRRLMRDVRAGMIDVVISYKLDRISRSLRDFYEFWGVLQEHGVTFVSATQSFDTSAPAGNLMLNILLSFAQFERETTAERTAARMMARAQRGLWNGGFVPLGYDYDRQAQLLVPNPEEAGIVRRIFEGIVSLGSLSKVCDDLTAAGMVTKIRLMSTRNGETRQVGGRRFRPDTVRGVIENPIYRGLITCQGEVFPGRHEPLVSSETFERANAVLNSSSRPRNPSPERDAHVHILKGLIRCADCGSTMTPYPSGKVGRNGEPFLHYACVSVVREPKRCKCRVRRLPARRFEDAVIGLLGEIGGDDGALERLADQARQHVGAELPRLRRERDECRSALDLLQEQSTRMIGVFKTRKRVPRSVVEEFERMEEEMEKRRIQFAALDARIGELEGGAPDSETLREMLEPFVGGMSGLSLEEKKQVIQGVIGEIRVERFVPPSDENDNYDRSGGSEIRTRRLLLNISLMNPGAPVSRRCRAVVSCWGDRVPGKHGLEIELHHGDAQDALSDLRRRQPTELLEESAADRALRFQRMLESGEVRNRSELARRLGCSRAWVTQVLRHLPARS